MKQKKFPADWNEKRVRGVVKHYESQSESAAVVEDKAAAAAAPDVVMKIPKEMVRQVRELIAKRKKGAWRAVIQ